MNTPNRKNRRAGAAQVRKTAAQAAKNAPKLRPIETDDEQKALECLRYQQHVRTIGGLQNQYVEKKQEQQELQQKMINSQYEMADLQQQITTFVGEARDQARTIASLGMTQAQIDRLASIPSIVSMVDMKKVLAEAGPPEEDEDTPADVTIGGNGETPPEEPPKEPSADGADDESPPPIDPPDDADRVKVSTDVLSEDGDDKEVAPDTDQSVEGAPA